MDNSRESQSFGEVQWDKTEHFVNGENQRIFCRYWKPNTEPKGIVFICHGAGEHSKWYTPLAHLLNEKGFLVCAHDHVGHGLSEGDRVHINQFSTYTSDLLQHVNIITAKYQDLPVFLIGHSMGGTISIMAGLNNPDVFNGIVLIAPAIVPNPESATWIKLTVAKLIAWLCPQAPIGSIHPEWVSRDKAIQEAYKNDQLNYHGRLKARWAMCMLDTLAEIQGRLTEIRWPFLLLHGDDDKLCELSGSLMMQDKAKSDDKTLKVYPGCYHQLHNEPDGVGEECKSLITQWITQRSR